MSKSTSPYTPAELAEFRDVINTKLADGRKDLQLLQDSFREALAEDPLATVDVNFGGDAPTPMTQAELQGLEERQMKYISLLEAALKHLDAGTYGICAETGQPIGAERLRLVPHARLSEEGKRKRNAASDVK